MSSFLSLNMQLISEIFLLITLNINRSYLRPIEFNNENHYHYGVSLARTVSVIIIS